MGGHCPTLQAHVSHQHYFWLLWKRLKKTFKEMSENPSGMSCMCKSNNQTVGVKPMQNQPGSRGISDPAIGRNSGKCSSDDATYSKA